MSIAGNETLANVANWPHFPAAVDLLYELSRIDAPGLKVAFSEGWITPFTRFFPTLGKFESSRRRDVSMKT